MELDKITLPAPEDCLSCIFNYDGIECRVYKEKFKKGYAEEFQYGERPKWCEWDEVTIAFHRTRDDQ